MASLQVRLREWEERKPSDPSEALTDFIATFESEVRIHIRRRLMYYNPKYTVLHGEDGVTQSVWGSVWRVIRNIDTISPERLRSLAHRISKYKMIKCDQKLSAASSPVYHEVPIQPEFDTECSSPTPDQVAATSDEWAVSIRDLPPRDRHIALLLKENRSAAEISKELNLTVRGAEKARKRLRKKLARLL
jgi:DNA-directed RNA polymerase specialized sigma24 family protein